ncbi:hypothetical protein ACFYWP_27220 [Actinacidiphila glaucinigra]|uniref:hypothetical protein n=1 Tax=Actinacidiphila glaucinigra TaxID=235986 RepID=UPI0036850DF2
MAVVVGDRSRFAAEVGEWDAALRRVDLWAAGQWLTCDDNMAFVEQFRLAVLDTAIRLRCGRGSPPPFDGLSPEAAHRRLMLTPGTTTRPKPNTSCAAGSRHCAGDPRRTT